MPVSANRLEWHTLAPDDAGRLTALGRPVLLEFTADWCINCKVLEKTVYDSASVVHAVNANHVAALRVDLTHSQPVLERLLVSYGGVGLPFAVRSEEHTSELQSLMRISYAVFCLNKKIKKNNN